MPDDILTREEMDAMLAATTPLPEDTVAPPPDVPIELDDDDLLIDPELHAPKGNVVLDEPIVVRRIEDIHAELPAPDEPSAAEEPSPPAPAAPSPAPVAHNAPTPQQAAAAVAATIAAPVAQPPPAVILQPPASRISISQPPPRQRMAARRRPRPTLWCAGTYLRYATSGRWLP